MTTCTQPNRFDEWEFEAFLDGLGNPDFARHLHECEHCAHQLTQLRAEAAQLDHLLARVDCPPADDLQRYRWGQLEPAQAQTVAAHIQVCTVCATEMAQFLGPLRAGQPAAQPQSLVASLEQTVRRQLRVLVAKLLPNDPQAIPALRGSSDLTMQSYRIDESGWELVVQVLNESTGYALAGQLRGPEDEVLQNAHATLLHGQHYVTEAGLDNTGWFELRVPESGIHQLVVEMPDYRIRADVHVGA